MNTYNLTIVIVLLIVLFSVMYAVQDAKNNLYIEHNLESQHNIHLITYGDGKYNSSKRRLVKEALDSDLFQSIKAYGRSNLTPEFESRFKDILNMKRGGGYWIWKFDLINSNLNQMNDGEFLIYMDAGSSIDVNAREDMYHYMDLLNNSPFGVLLFQKHNLPERKYTSGRLLNYFSINPESDIAKSGQLHCSIILIQKKKHSVDFFHKCLEVLNDDPYIITDRYNKENQYLIDHRHDQSLMSIIGKSFGCIILDFKTNKLFKKTTKRGVLGHMNKLFTTPL
jgi:hypothetical protein